MNWIGNNDVIQSICVAKYVEERNLGEILEDKIGLCPTVFVMLLVLFGGPVLFVLIYKAIILYLMNI